MQGHHDARQPGVMIHQYSVVVGLGGKAYRSRVGRSSRKGRYSKTWRKMRWGASSERLVSGTLILCMFPEHGVSEMCGLGREKKREVLSQEGKTRGEVGGVIRLDTHSVVPHR